MKVTWLRGGLIVDGTSAPGWKGDMLLVDGRIAPLATQLTAAQRDAFGPASDVEEIDCAGKVIAPGFIDVHTHDAATVLDMPQNLPKLSQGVTTVIECGPGKVLAGMVKRIDAEMTGAALFDPATLNEVKGLLS